MTIIDPKDVSAHDLPRVVFSANSRSFFGFGIRTFSKGVYNHACLQYEPDYIASQDFLFHSVPIEEYMQPHIKLKFFGFKNITSGQRQAMLEAIRWNLILPWYKRAYDIPGIFGHILRMPNTLQLPHLNYCTESVSKIVKLGGYNPPKHPSVKALNRWFLTFPGEFSRDGYHIKD